MFYYQRFAGAITRGDVDELGDLVDRRFRAILPGGPQEEGLDFDSFVSELERRRAPFSDFGQNVEILRVFPGSYQIAVYYAMTLTHDGVLSSRSGVTAPPSGQTVRLTAVDMVSFSPRGESLVTELVTVSDRLATTMQMGGMPG